MPLRFRPGDRIDSLLFNQVLALPAGTGWLGGGDASIVAESTNPIELDVESASVRVEGGEAINVEGDTVALPDPDGSHPRRDVLYADSDGSLDIEAGAPQPMIGAEVAPDTTDRMTHLEQPLPPDVHRHGGVPLWEIFVPQRAKTAEDLLALDGRALRDRRQLVITDQSISASHGGLSGLLEDHHPQYLPVNGTRKADPSIIGGGNSDQVVTSDGSDSQWNSPAFMASIPPTDLDAAGDPEDSVTDHIPCPEGVTILNIGVVGNDGTAQSAVEAEVAVPDSSADPTTTTDPSTPMYLYYNAPTTVSFSLTNTSGSPVRASAKLFLRRHAPLSSRSQ